MTSKEKGLKQIAIKILLRYDVSFNINKMYSNTKAMCNYHQHKQHSKNENK
jgi:hypothetical protein